GDLPTAWSEFLARTYGATVALTDDRPHSGRRCVEIRHDPNEHSGMTGQVYVVQTIAARPFRGHRVELSGWLRREAPPGVTWPVSVHLWMSCDGSPDGLANLGNHPVRSERWTFARTTMEIPSNADSLTLG